MRRKMASLPSLAATKEKITTFFRDNAPAAKANLQKAAKNAVTVAGVYTLAKAGLGVLSFLWKHYGPAAKLDKFGAGKNAYVVITGSFPFHVLGLRWFFFSVPLLPLKVVT